MTTELAPAVPAHGTKTTLFGWGANKRVECFVEVPETPDHVRKLLGEHGDEHGTIARGLGRSYGDPAVNSAGQVVEMTKLDRYLDFDQETGVLECEAGVSLAQIIEHFTPRGWFPMITPGTKYVTIGGCIANDVHGKAHHAQGSFCTCVESMTVLLASGEIVRTSRTEFPELFWGTFGGMGLLGIVLTARLRLRRIETSYFSCRAIVVKDLEALLDAFEETAEIPYSVAWIDSLATGARLGRGVLSVGDHAKLGELPPALAAAPLRTFGPPKISVPFELPEFTLNRWTIGMLNVVANRSLATASAFGHYEGFFYPLDKFGSWYRAYGRRGFTQYQFVIPMQNGRAHLRTLLETIASSGQLPFLNVLKKFGAQSEGHLSFPFEGYTFAIDFPIRDGLPELIARLDAMVVEYGGRIYLGKDSFVTATSFRAMYPRLDAWLQIKAAVDPAAVFTSDLARRVGLVSA